MIKSIIAFLLIAAHISHPVVGGESGSERSSINSLSLGLFSVLLLPAEIFETIPIMAFLN
jgi:hypothetical protein